MLAASALLAGCWLVTDRSVAGGMLPLLLLPTVAAGWLEFLRGSSGALALVLRYMMEEGRASKREGGASCARDEAEEVSAAAVACSAASAAAASTHTHTLTSELLANHVRLTHVHAHAEPRWCATAPSFPVACGSASLVSQRVAAGLESVRVVECANASEHLCAKLRR